MSGTNNEQVKSKKLGLWTLVAIATGNVIGAGVITTTGLAIGATGQSVWIAYGAAVLLGFLWILPTIYFSSIVKYKGGGYTMVTALIGEKAGGVFALWWLPMFLMIGLLGSATGMYINSVIPAISVKSGAVFMLILFYVVNLFGTDIMTKLQNPLTTFLIFSLIAFGIIGFGHLQPNAFAVTSPDYYRGGVAGLMAGMGFLVYSTSGHSLVAGLSWEAKNPKKNIPLSIIITTGIILVVYCIVSFTAGNVLPVEVVANKPLTLVAKEILPDWLFLIFIVGGPIMALITTLNAGFSTLAAPAIGAVKKGWLPVFMSKENKYGAPWIIYTIMFLVGVIPLLAGISLSTFTVYTVLTMRITGTLSTIAALAIPTKFKDAWKKSWMHIPDSVYYVVIGSSALSQLYIVYTSAVALSMNIFIGNMILVLALAAYAFYRYYTGKTNVQIAYTLEDDED